MGGGKKEMHGASTRTRSHCRLAGGALAKRAQLEAPPIAPCGEGGACALQPRVAGWLRAASRAWKAPVERGRGANHPQFVVSPSKSTRGELCVCVCARVRRGVISFVGAPNAAASAREACPRPWEGPPRGCSPARPPWTRGRGWGRAPTGRCSAWARGRGHGQRWAVRELHQRGSREACEHPPGGGAALQRQNVRLAARFIGAQGRPSLAFASGGTGRSYIFFKESTSNGSVPGRHLWRHGTELHLTNLNVTDLSLAFTSGGTERSYM